MAKTPIQIKRYPNRRYYARHTSQYVSLKEIEALVQSGETVEIKDSQTGEDLTRTVLTQIIMERQPDKMAMFPADMLHFIVRSNDAMSGFLSDYFHQSLTYLDYLQRHSTTTPFHHPMHWVKAWLDRITAQQPPAAVKPADTAEPEPAATTDAQLAARLRELEERLRKLESPQS